MRTLRLIFAFFVIAIVSGQSVSAAWVEGKTKHFTLYGDMSEKDMREFGQKLERFHSVMKMMTSPKAETPVTIYIVSDVSAVQDLFGKGGRGVAGFYSANSQGAFAITPASSGNGEWWQMSGEAILYHEYAHHMLLANTDQYVPGWMTEGLAELFMTAVMKSDGSVIIGTPNQTRVFAIQDMHAWNAKQMLESDTRKVTQSEIEQKYSTGWLVVHYLLFSGKRKGEFGTFVNALNNGLPTMAAAEKAFGDLNKFSSEVEAYRRKRGYNGVRLTDTELKPDLDVAVRTLRAGEAKMMPYRMQSARGVDEAQAQALVKKAAPVAAAYPNDPWVQRAFAEMQFDSKNYDGTDAAADLAIAAEPQNVMALVYKGRAQAMRALATAKPEDWVKARNWFLKANRADPTDAAPLVDFYDSFVAARQEPSKGAVAGLMSAVVLMPQDDTIRARAGIELIRSGDLKLARTILGPTAFNPHAGADNPYQKLIAMMDAGDGSEAIMEKAKELKVDRINLFDPPKADKDKDGDKGK